MSKKLKLSPWHDGSVKPVHVGVYERNWKKYDSFFTAGPYYAYWDGRQWNESRTDISGAISEESIDYASRNQTDLDWRGVLK